MSEALFDVTTPETTFASATVWTERMMLDLVRERYEKVRPGNGPRYIVAEHVQNHAGFAQKGRTRIADALVVDLWESSGHAIHGIEVKVSRSDWLTELKDPSKAEAFRPYCDFWWLAVPDVSIVREDLPDGWGLLAVDATGFLRVKRRAPKNPRQSMPFTMTASWLRAVSKAVTR